MKNSGFMMRPRPLHCGNCGEQRNLTVTKTHKHLKQGGRAAKHVKVKCRACRHEWWSRHADALKGPVA